MTNEPWAIFDAEYAGCYDATTGHREDEVETDGLWRMIHAHAAGPTPRVLDVGCGTGRHARRLAQRGAAVMGLDPSPGMIARAKQAGGGVRYCCGSVDSFAESGFDFAYSLGHVLNYLPDESGLHSFLRGVRAALREDGAYYFECWNPEAMLQDPPRPVSRKFEDGSRRIHREVLPKLDNFPRSLELSYQIEIAGPGDETPRRLERIHRLRLFFPEEFEKGLKESGFSGWEFRAALAEPAELGTNARFLGVLCRP